MRAGAAIPAALPTLSKVINSISGRIAVISLASTLPMIQVKRVSGHAAWKARSAANAWQVSPIAERRSRHTCCSGGLKLKVVIRMINGGQRIATATGVMLADPHGLGNPRCALRGVAVRPGVLVGARRTRRRVRRPRLGVVHRRRGRSGCCATIAAAVSSPRISKDRYLWTGERRVRAFAEWRLLAHLAEAGLPVPKPVAAFVSARRPAPTAAI